MTAMPALRGVYGISVMSELSGVGPQTLRLYERRGLLTPTRTSGGTRRYSEADLDTLRRITALIDEGINLVGVRRILSLETENTILKERLAQGRGTADVTEVGIGLDGSARSPVPRQSSRRGGHRVSVPGRNCMAATPGTEHGTRS